MPQTIDISDLPEPLVQAIETIVRTYRSRTPQGPGGQAARRPLGWARGVLPELPHSFSDPLPDAVLDLFEGKNP